MQNIVKSVRAVAQTRALSLQTCSSQNCKQSTQMRLLISSAPSDLNVKLSGSVIYEEDYKVS